MYRQVLGALVLLALASRPSFAVPTITVSWGESSPPVEGSDYYINGTDVSLIHGSNTWQISSTDGNSAGGSRQHYL